MIQLNLLPDVKKEFLRAESARRKTIAMSILITIIAAGLTAVIAFYVYAVQNVILYAQTNDIKSKSDQLNKVQDIDKYLVIQNQLSQLNALHGSKNNFSRLLDFLPKINPAPPQNVTLNALDVMSVEGTMSFKGKVNDYSGLTTFKDTLSNAEFSYQAASGEKVEHVKLFKEVVIETASFDKSSGNGSVSFSVLVTYDPAVFLHENTEVVVSVPSKETTGSVVGSPQAIFGGDQ